MPEGQAPGSGDRKPLLKSEDFKEELRTRDERDVRAARKLPDVDDILKALQEEHGIRIGLSPKLTERVEAIKASAPKQSDAAGFGCSTSDTCILCDTDDFCRECDTMDWCISVDVHVVPE
jgi:hypothetical protein